MTQLQFCIQLASIMSEIKERCHTHGDIDLGVVDVTIRSDKSHREIPYYEFECEQHVIRKAVSAHILATLSNFGVALVEYDSTTNTNIAQRDIQSQSMAGKQAGILCMAEISRFERLDNESLNAAVEQELFANP